MLACVLVMLGPGIARAVGAVPPTVESGSVGRHNAESRRRLEKSVPKVRIQGPVIVGPRRPSAQKIPPEAARFTLRKVLFTPSYFLSAEKLRDLSAPYLGHPITIVDLYRLVDAVNALYAKKGLITDRAILPLQHIRNGTVHIELVEGKVGRIEFSGKPYTSRRFMLKRLKLRKGEVLDTAAFGRRLIYFNRTNSLALRAMLKPGHGFGLTDVVLDPVEPPRYRTYLLLNNEGYDATGRLQGGVYAQLNGPLRRGDQLSIYLLKSRGGFNGNIAYQVPLTVRGLSLSVSASHNQIHIVSGPFSKIGITGHANVGRIGISQPVLVTRRWLVGVGASVAYTDSRTDVSGAPLSKDRIWSTGVNFSAQYDRPGQQWSLSTEIRHGLARELLGNHRSYWVLTGEGAGTVDLPGPYFARLQWTWQYSSADTLPSSELYQLGGVGTVPGYPVGTASGASGYDGRFGLGRHLPLGMAARVFYDSGTTFVAFPNQTTLTSIGVGLAGNLPGWRRLGHTVWSLDAAHPLGTVVPGQSQWIVYFRLAAPLSF